MASIVRREPSESSDEDREPHLPGHGWAGFDGEGAQTPGGAIALGIILNALAVAGMVTAIPFGVYRNLGAAATLSVCALIAAVGGIVLITTGIRRQRWRRRHARRTGGPELGAWQRTPQTPPQ